MADRAAKKWDDLDGRRKALRLAGYDYTNRDDVFFLTECARHLRQPFLDASLANGIIESILRRVTRSQWSVYVYCLMPDHLHLAVSPQPGSGGLSRIMQGFKSYTTRLGWERGLRQRLWQRSYYDHIARREDDLAGICRYILANPVRGGLVSDPDCWPYSGMPDPLPG